MVFLLRGIQNYIWSQNTHAILLFSHNHLVVSKDLITFRFQGVIFFFLTFVPYLRSLTSMHPVEPKISC